MKRLKGFMAVVVFAAILMMATSATADIIYNNLSSGYQISGIDPYVYVSGAGIGFMNYQWNAVTFTPFG